MAEVRRSILAQTPAHARGAADSLIREGFAVEAQHATWIVLRKKKRRGDELVTIMISEPTPLAGDGALPPPTVQPVVRRELPHLYSRPEIPPDAPRSDDGRWWWDGQQWRAVV